MYSECPAGMWWDYHPTFDSWTLYKDDRSPVLYVDWDLHKFIVYTNERDSYVHMHNVLAEFKTEEEAKHYCHMLILTGAV